MQEQNDAQSSIVVRWRSFELRPAGSPPMPAEYRERIEASRPQLYATARERYGLELNVGPFGINSRLALIGEKYADQQEVGELFHAGVMTAYWAEARDISDRNVLAEVATASGLDRDAFLAALDDPRYGQMVQEDIDLAQRYGLNSVPALVFDNKYLVSGAQPVEVLRQVVGRIRET